MVANESKALRRMARKLVRAASGEVRICYEAGPCGFDLRRQLEVSSPELICEVVPLVDSSAAWQADQDRSPRCAPACEAHCQGDQLSMAHAPTEAQAADRATFESYRLHLSQLQDRLQDLAARIEAISQLEPYRGPVS